MLNGTTIDLQNNGVNVQVDSGILTLRSSVIQRGAITKSGSGTLLFDRDNLVNALVINQGSVILRGGLTLNGQALRIPQGTTFGGAGALQRQGGIGNFLNVTNAGRIAPNNLLSILGNVTFEPTTVIDLNLDQNSQLFVSGGSVIFEANP